MINVSNHDSKTSIKHYIDITIYYLFYITYMVNIAPTMEVMKILVTIFNAISDRMADHRLKNKSGKVDNWTIS